MLGKKRGFLVFALTVVMSVGMILSGCGGNDTSQNTATSTTQTSSTGTAAVSTDPAQDPIEISFFISDPGQAPTADNKMYKLIKDKLGVTCKWEFLVGDKSQKIGVMIAGGDYPDVTFVDSDSVGEFSSAGALLPLEDLIAKNAPNLQNHYGPYLNKLKDPSDGHFYVMANFNRIYGDFKANIWEGPAFWIQKDVLKEAGYPKVRTLDQYFEIIEKYKANHPEIDGQPTIGFEILCEGWRDFCLKNPPEHLIGHPNDGDVVVNPETNVAEFFRDKDYAKRYYKKLNEVYHKGLIDPEAFTMSYDQYQAKISSGRILGMFDQHWVFSNAERTLITANKLERTYAPCAITYDESIKDYYYDRPVLNVNTGFGITKNCKNPERVIKFFDSIMTEEWQKLLGWGVKDEDYLVDENGQFYRNQQQRDNGNDNTWRLANQAYTLWYYGPKMDGTFSDGNATTPGYQPKEFYDSLKDYDKEFFKAYGIQTYTEFFSPAPENRVSYPAWQIDLIDGSPANMADIKIEEVGTKLLPKAILAKPDQFDKVWDEYVTALNKCDIKSMMDRINDQLKWRTENWK